MSEQAIHSPLSGIGLESSGAKTGTYPLIKSVEAVPAGSNVAPASGKVAPDTGNLVPPAAAEKPDLQELAKRLNMATLSIGHDLHFEVDLKNGSAIIQVLDRQTGDIVRQIPAEKASLAIRQNGNFQLRLFDALV